MGEASVQKQLWTPWKRYQQVRLDYLNLPASRVSHRTKGCLARTIVPAGLPDWNMVL